MVYSTQQHPFNSISTTKHSSPKHTNSLHFLHQNPHQFSSSLDSFYFKQIMACALQATLAANSCAFSTRRFSLKQQKISKRNSCMFIVRASSDDSDCNDEECAPEKEVSSCAL